MDKFFIASNDFLVVEIDKDMYAGLDPSEIQEGDTPEAFFDVIHLLEPDVCGVDLSLIEEAGLTLEPCSRMQAEEWVRFNEAKNRGAFG